MPATTPPGPSGFESLKLTRGFQQDPIAVFRDLAATYGEVVRFNLGGQTVYFLSGAETAAHVLVSKQENYVRVNYPSVDDMIGVALFTASGETWARSRSLAQPMFAARKLPNYADQLVQVAARTADTWADGPLPREIGMVSAMREMALDGVSRALFGPDTSGHMAAMTAAIRTSETVTGKVLRSPLVLVLNQLPGVGPDRAWRMQFRRRAKVRGAAREFDRIIDEIRAKREAEQDPGEDLLGQLLTSRDETTGEPLTRTKIRDEATGYLFAAQDTTGLTLSWLWYRLAAHPEAREKLEAEVDEVLGDRMPTAADADRLQWTRACVSETLRMHPVVWALDRTAMADDEVQGYRIPAGSRVMVIPPVNHWDTKWWPEPDRFDPSRFMPGNDKGRPRTAYLPFGGGRRICIGMSFAMMEITMATAVLARRFRVDLLPGAEVGTHIGVVMAPEGGLPMKISAR